MQNKIICFIKLLLFYLQSLWYLCFNLIVIVFYVNYMKYNKILVAIFPIIISNVALCSTQKPTTESLNITDNTDKQGISQYNIINESTTLKDIAILDLNQQNKLNYKENNNNSVVINNEDNNSHVNQINSKKYSYTSSRNFISKNYLKQQSIYNDNKAQIDNIYNELNILRQCYECQQYYMAQFSNILFENNKNIHNIKNNQMKCNAKFNSIDNLKDHILIMIDISHKQEQKINTLNDKVQELSDKFETLLEKLDKLDLNNSDDHNKNNNNKHYKHNKRDRKFHEIEVDLDEINSKIEDKK